VKFKPNQPTNKVPMQEHINLLSGFDKQRKQLAIPGLITTPVSLSLLAAVEGAQEIFFACFHYKMIKPDRNDIG